MAHALADPHARLLEHSLTAGAARPAHAGEVGAMVGLEPDPQAEGKLVQIAVVVRQDDLLWIAQGPIQVGARSIDVMDINDPHFT